MQETMESRILGQIQHVLNHSVIHDRRYLDDEQLVRSAQLAVLEAIFNDSIRETELKELSSHFAPVLRASEADHPCHLAIWGKTGTGKTLTVAYFLNLLGQMCRQRGIPLRYEHLDLSTPRPCFRALNDLACLLNASKRYKKGISLEELMLRIEAALASYTGYLVLFIDEVDHVRRDSDTFFTFLVRRLPQRIPAKLILVFASNRLDWPEHLDPRVKSFLKLNELVFTPYDALALQKILRIRVDKALHPEAVDSGVIEKIAALASRDHGDARQAVALLAKSAYLAEKAGSKITLGIVDEAASVIEQDRYLLLIRTAPVQFQAVLAAVIQVTEISRGKPVGTGEAYDAYRLFCDKISQRPLTARAFTDVIAELDVYSFLRTRLLSRGRYGRTREIQLDLPEDVVAKVRQAIESNLDISSRRT